MELAPSSATKKLHLISLGCARNQVDSEVILGSFFESGWSVVAEPINADAVIINTCGFIQSAKEESIDTILQMADIKKKNPDMKLVVSGCLTQRYKGQLAKALPEVDLFVGTDEFINISKYLQTETKQGTVFAKRSHYIYNEYLPRVNTLSRYSAYVKVAEGCQHNCSFCIIPAIRGKLRSRSIDSVVNEAIQLAEDGVQEINLIAQDLAAYGRETGEDKLLELLRRLEVIEGLQWVRLLYMYPENISDEFLTFFRESKKLVKYLDIPIQHASDAMLDSMGRHITSTQLKKIVRHVREQVPGIAIRTTVMVGYPGETDADFQELRAFVEEMEFDHLGCFQYSKEEGTKAARLPDHIKDSVKEKRFNEIMQIQRSVSQRRLNQYLDKTVQVLVTSGLVTHDGEACYEGRMSTQAPEVDGITYVVGKDLVPGQRVTAFVTKTFDYDLQAAVISLH